ncbi:MAG: lipid-A-disaccharide synthase [Planctomycetes bacterium]|nr:lipid-A-disaccharide synthase [Planctomycetota bacterium]
MKIFFSAGEPSGDMHGANLIRQLRRLDPNFEAVGYGGPKMAEAGCRLHEDLTRLAVMWILRALLNLHKFLYLAWRADRYFRHHKPDAVVLIDFPGFNWWIARRAKAHGIATFYYAPPQLWAWGGWRVGKMRKFVDHVLCSMTFEQEWYAQRGCNATLVGHPYFDEMHQREALDGAFLDEQRRNDGPLVAILPGSRTQEVTHNLPWFLDAAEKVQARVSGVRFAVASFKPIQAEMARRMIAGRDLRVEVFCGRTAELIEASDCCMAVSGSVSLELLYYTKPTVILYWITRTAYFVQRYFRKVKYITLVNLLSVDQVHTGDNTPFDPNQPDAEKVLFPEYLTCEDKTEQIAAHVVEWLTDEDARARRVGQLAELKQRIAHGGASRMAADYIVAHLKDARLQVPRPHYLPGSKVFSEQRR